MATGCVQLRSNATRACHSVLMRWTDEDDGDAAKLGTGAPATGVAAPPAPLDTSTAHPRPRPGKGGRSGRGVGVVGPGRPMYFGVGDLVQRLPEPPDDPLHAPEDLGQPGFGVTEYPAATAAQVFPARPERTDRSLAHRVAERRWMGRMKSSSSVWCRAATAVFSAAQLHRMATSGSLLRPRSGPTRSRLPFADKQRPSPLPPLSEIRQPGGARHHTPRTRQRTVPLPPTRRTCRGSIRYS